MKLDKMRNCIILVGLFITEVHCQFSSLQLFESTSGCYGIDSDETKVNATCEAGHSVAINNVTMGAKPTSLDCPWIFNTSFDFNTCCTYDENDCVFPFSETNDQYHSMCNGKSSCTPQIQNQNIPASCISQNETYGAEGLSHYMFMDFYCIQDDKMVDMCSGTNSPLTVENTEVYIWNRDFSNSEIGPGDSGCNCSIEIDNCDSEINIYTIYRKLTGDEDGMCNQSLRIFVGENSGGGLDWSCSDNKPEFETNTVAETYIYINLENRRTSTGGKFWLGFGATMDSNITASCPPRSQEHCLLSTTTQVTSTTVAESTTTETPTNTTYTDVTSSTTEMTTDTTTTTSVTSTTLLSTTTETTPAETTIDDTSTTTETIASATKHENDTGLLVAVIVLAILVSGLAIAVVVLSCCLYNIRRRAKTEDDTEKVISNNYQTLSPDLASNIFAVSNTPMPSKDIGCQVKFVPQTTDFSCQVERPRELINVQSLSPPRVKMFDRGTNTVPPCMEETSTITSQKSDKMCQTTDVKRKDQNIQINLKFSSPMKTVSCQTEETSNEQTQPKIPPPVTNGVIPALRETDDSSRKSEENMRDTDGNKRKSRRHKHKKSRKNILEYVNDEMSDSWLDRSTKSPANLDSIQPEFTEEPVLLSSVDQNDDNYASDEVADNDIPIKIHTTQVSSEFSEPVTHTTINHVLNVRKAITNSFFGKERFEEKIIRLMSKPSRSAKSKKIIRKKSSSHQ